VKSCYHRQLSLSSHRPVFTGVLLREILLSQAVITE
jgi:hypothetical protein